MDYSKFLTTNKNKKHIIFDFDGVIYSLDWDWGSGNALQEFRKKIRDAVAEIDPELPPKSGLEFRSTILADLAIKKHGDLAKDILFPIYREKEATLLDTATPHKKTIEFIKEQSGNFDLYIWSNNQLNTIERLLKRSGIMENFKLIAARDKFAFAKPEVSGFELIYRPETQQKRDFIMLGDSDYDEEAAKNAGIDFVYYKPD